MPVRKKRTIGLMELIPLLTAIVGGIFAIGNTYLNKVDLDKTTSTESAAIKALTDENTALKIQIAVLEERVANLGKTTQGLRARSAPRTMDVAPEASALESFSSAVESSAKEDLVTLQSIPQAMQDRGLIGLFDSVKRVDWILWSSLLSLVAFIVFVAMIIIRGRRESKES